MGTLRIYTDGMGRRFGPVISNTQKTGMLK